MSITEIIKPIKLLSGSHDDTAKTGQGCFMNVIAYLNGEDQITDASPCVCGVVRPLVIRFNDFLKADERQELIPFIERAMGSATNDPEEIKRRLGLLITHGCEMESWWRNHANANAIADANAYVYATTIANAYASAIANANAYVYATTIAYANANAIAYANAYAIANAYAYANASANADAEYRAYFKKSCFFFLDAALPKAQKFDSCVLDRAKKLAEFA